MGMLFMRCRWLPCIKAKGAVMSILNKKSFAAFAAAAIMISSLSSCKNVSENAELDEIQTAVPFSLTEQETHSEEETTSQSSAAIRTEETTSKNITTSEKADETTATEAEAAEATEKATETAVPTAEISSASGTSYTEETTAATIQTESPAEPVAVTAVTTTSAAARETAAAVYSSNSYSALNYKTQKGVWISYLEYGSIMTGKSSSSFRASISEYFDNIKSLDFNTVYVQVRAFGDAYYDSTLFPTGDKMTGTIDDDAPFDPLEIMVEEAHRRGLSIHAWINPMRLMTDSQIKVISDSYTIEKWYNDSDKNGKYIVKSGDRWYLNPAYSEVRKLIADGIAEITANYDVDGIQIDDYFYPTTDSSFDESAYTSSGTEKSLSQWRIDCVNSMVKKLCSTVHNANSTVIFGISPQGSVDNNYSELYADVKTWCKSTDYCDYILPQVYFGFDNPALPYSDVIALWSSMTSSGNVKLVIGLAGYKIGAVDTYAGSGKNEWINNSDILSRQIELAETLSNYGGVAIFRYGSIFEPDSSVANQVQKELNNIKK